MTTFVDQAIIFLTARHKLYFIKTKMINFIYIRININLKAYRIEKNCNLFLMHVVITVI